MSDLKQILQKHGFGFTHSLGQNFLTDTNLLRAIAADANLTLSDVVVEVGAGAGTLTRALAETAKEVVTFEIDSSLKSVLDETLFGLDNVRVVIADALKCPDDELDGLVGKKYKLVANLPYYVTTPLLFKFIERPNPPETIVVTVQKEVADRMVAAAGTADYGALTVAVGLYYEVRRTRTVGRAAFMPPPGVDSAVVAMTRRDGAVYDAFLSRVVRSGFAMRRKTLSNNLSAAFGLDKSVATEMLCSLGFSPSVRGEELTPSDYIRLAACIKEIRKDKEGKR